MATEELTMTEDELLDLLRTTEEWADKPFTTAREIAERVGLTRQRVHDQLQQAVDNHDRVRKYIPARDAIYWYENDE
jgi:hypothetical protein